MTREEFMKVVTFMGSVRPEDIQNKEVGNLAVKEVVSTDVIDTTSFVLSEESISPVVGDKKKYRVEDEIELPFNCIPRDVVYGERVELPEFKHIKSFY